MEQLLTNMASIFGTVPGLNNDSIVVATTDPNQRIASMEILSGSGDPIPSNTFQQAVGNGVHHKYLVYNFERGLPKGAIMQIVIATPKAMATIPFLLKDVPLP